MNRLELDELINNRKEVLSNTYTKPANYDYCLNFVKKYNDMYKLEDFAEIDIWYFLKCLYSIMSNNHNIEEINDNFNAFIPFFEMMNADDLEGFNDVCNMLYDSNNVNDAFNFLKDEKVVQKFIDDYYSSFDLIDEDLMRINTSEVDISKFFYCFRELGQPFLKIIALYKTYRNVRFDLDVCKNELKFANIRNKDKDQILTKILKESYKVDLILKDANEVKNYIFNINKEEKAFNRNRLKEINGLDNSIDLLDLALKNDEVTNAREIIRDIKDIEIKYNVLKLIEEHNNNYYLTLDEEFNRLNKNSKIKYQALLSDYGITKGTYEVDNIIHNSLEDVNLILSIITKYNFSNREIIDVLNRTKLSIVTKIKEYIDRGYINVEFIKDNLDIFYENSNKFIIISENIDLFNNNGINPSILSDSINTLLLDRDLLKNNIDILKRYNLINSLKTTSNYNFFSDSDLYIKIDELIELGYLSFLEEDLNLLNSNKLKRLEVLKHFGIKVESHEELDNYLDNKFFINDNEIEDFIPDIIVPDDVDIDISKLNEFKENNLIFNIDNVLISVNKVDRELKHGRSVNEALFYNMHMSNDEYKNVMKLINGYEYHK